MGHRRSIRGPAAMLIAILGLMTTASADPSYVSTAVCAWEKGALKVVVVPSPFAQVIGNEQDTISISVPGGVEGVVLLPGGTPDAAPWEAPYTLAAAEAVEHWETAAHAYAASHPDAAHLSELSIDVEILTPDSDPSAVADADVFVVFAPHMGTIAGLAVQSCQASTDLSSCQPTTCEVPLGSNIVLSSMFVWSMTPEDIYNTTLHEFGHVLGHDHVVRPEQDTMFGLYQYQPGVITNPKQCLSNLNLEQLAESYRWLDGQTPHQPQPFGVSIPAAEYAQLC